MQERLEIRNFAGFNSVAFDIAPMTVLIGPQAAGKSVCAKLAYYFRNIFQEAVKSFELSTFEEFKEKYEDKFESYFPKFGWNKSRFDIKYRFKDHWLQIKLSGTDVLTFDCSAEVRTVFEQLFMNFYYSREESFERDFYSDLTGITKDFWKKVFKIYGDAVSNYQVFVPAGRSFFSVVAANVFSIIQQGNEIDPFLTNFGFNYQNQRRKYLRTFLNGVQLNNAELEFEDLSTRILRGEYQSENNLDFLVHNDEHRVHLANASSGQQEILPMLILLRTFFHERWTSDQFPGVTFYIEEPEAHLFPTAQREIVELLAVLFEFTGEHFQFVITTHSPYVLTSINNLLEAGRIRLESSDAKMQHRLSEIIPSSRQLSPEHISAYELKQGKIQDLSDPETGLLLAESLDAVSENIAIDFEKLLDI